MLASLAKCSGLRSLGSATSSNSIGKQARGIVSLDLAGSSTPASCAPKSLLSSGRLAASPVSILLMLARLSARCSRERSLALRASVRAKAWAMSISL